MLDDLGRNWFELVTFCIRDTGRMFRLDPFLPDY